jgi:hypothetical protein
METHMHKRLATLSIFPFALSEAIADWLSQLHGWNEARRLRKASRKRAEVISGLRNGILYDIGESDIRPFRSPIWNNNPYRLLIDGIMNRGTSELDSRR